jgi:hypothetical protein
MGDTGIDTTTLITTSQTKKCNKCQVIKSFNEFHKDCSKQDGVRTTCKVCSCKQKVEYYNSNIEKLRNRGKLYYKLNIETRIKYLEKNKERLKVQAANHHRKKLRTNPVFRMAHCMRSRICTARKSIIKSEKIDICKRGQSKTLKFIGCTFEKLMEWLGPQPTTDAQIDHIVPCAQAQSEDELILLQHHTNLQWLSREENLEKRDNATPDGLLLCEVLLGRPWIYKQGEK